MTSDPTLGGSNLGGGAYNGIMVKQTQSNQRAGEFSVYRRVLRNSWNGMNLWNEQNDQVRLVTPFRAANNSGDYLGRVNYSCGGPNPQSATKPGYGRRIGSVPNHCDTKGVEGATCNPRFVADSSDYIRFKKLKAVNRTYNDKGYGGDDSNASYVPLMHVRRGLRS
jgi:hypothetical protein